MRFNDQWRGQRLSDLRRQLYGMFEELLRRAREGLNDNDAMRLIIRHQALNHAVVIPLQEAIRFSVEQILERLENVLQSEETLAIDESFIGKLSRFLPSINFY